MQLEVWCKEGGAGVGFASLRALPDSALGGDFVLRRSTRRDGPAEVRISVHSPVITGADRITYLLPFAVTEEVGIVLDVRY